MKVLLTVPAPLHQRLRHDAKARGISIPDQYCEALQAWADSSPEQPYTDPAAKIAYAPWVRCSGEAFAGWYATPDSIAKGFAMLLESPRPEPPAHYGRQWPRRRLVPERTPGVLRPCLASFTRSGPPLSAMLQALHQAFTTPMPVTVDAKKAEDMLQAVGSWPALAAWVDNPGLPCIIPGQTAPITARALPQETVDSLVRYPRIDDAWNYVPDLYRTLCQVNKTREP